MQRNFPQNHNHSRREINITHKDFNTGTVSAPDQAPAATDPSLSGTDGITEHNNINIKGTPAEDASASDASAQGNSIPAKAWNAGTEHAEAGNPDAEHADTGNPEAENADAGNAETGNSEAENVNAWNAETGHADAGNADAGHAAAEPAPENKGITFRPLTAEELEEERKWAEAAAEKQKAAFRVYRRKLIATIILAVIAFLCILCAAIGASLGLHGFKASADTVSNESSYRHKLDIDLVMPVSTAVSYEYEAYLYGPDATSSSGTDTVEDGVIFSFAPTKLEIIIPAGRLVTQYASVKQYGRIYDFSLTGPVSYSNSSVCNGSMTDETSVTYTFAGLADGVYTIRFTKDEYSYSSTQIGGTYEGYVNEVTTTFTFTIDTTPPEVCGAYADKDNPLYVTSDFTVSATDALSGVSSLGYQTPTGSTFIWGAGSSRSFTLAANGEGLYKFAAMDKAGNTTTYFYVCLDATAPEITVKGADFGGVTDSSFSVTSTDSASAVTLYCCRTDTGTWYTAEGGTVTVPYNNGDGEYQFYATDAAGNSTEKYYVTLSTEDIEGFFVQNDSDNSQYFYWTNTNWTATLDGEPYERSTWITAEGDHEIILTSRYGDTLSYSCSIDHFYVQAGTVEPTCSEEGYTLYCCVHCGDTYKADITATTKHDYRALYTMPTCTEQGYMTYTCADCGCSYTDGYTDATGHYYTKTTIAPTCDSEGFCLYECIVCGYSYTTDYTPETDHDYVVSYTAPTCTMAGLYTYTCSICGDSYVEETGYPTDHTYEIKVIKTPTCEEEGERYYKCTVCGYDFYVTVPALGHAYVIETQYTVDGDTMRVYVCAECGDEYTEDLGNQTEYVAGFVDELFSSYSSYMWWILLAVAGIWSVVMGIMFIRARRAEDKDKAKRMLVNYLLGLVIIAVIIVAAPYLAYGIASLVT
ncbi:MAG: hypothetical protein LUD51_07100 [Clostridia bacterium]|nr:hypothetical protein [Clostridia bacterium]